MGTAPLEELLNINLDHTSTQPLYLQLYQLIAKQIVNRQLSPRSRLPASRKLANQLHLSRNTVQRAYDQLTAEGYLTGIPGSGVYVSAEIPDDYCQPQKTSNQQKRNKTSPSTTRRAGLFTPGIPDLENFPQAQWSKCHQKVLRLGYKQLLYAEQVCGNETLKKTLVSYLAYARNVHCTADQIIITSGAQEAINLTMRALLNKKTLLAIENPGYQGAYQAAKNCQTKLCPIPVLQDGIDLDYLAKKKPSLIYITPSHQYPMGTTLPISKRLALIDFAERTGSYVIEDDYDSEFHYKTKPLPSLQGLDPNDRVIYLGTFSKVLFPAIRLGFLVVPPKLVTSFKEMKHYGFGQTPLINQVILNEFILAGHFTRHIKRMRLLYAQKLQVIKAACKKHLTNEVELHANEIGLHVTLKFIDDTDEDKVISQLNQKGFYPTALSKYYHSQPKHKGLVIGFSNTPSNQLKAGIIAIAAALKQCKRK